MPLATTWEQERWDIRDVPYFDPFEDEYDPNTIMSLYPGGYSYKS
jgi:hypothetical protein